MNTAKFAVYNIDKYIIFKLYFDKYYILINYFKKVVEKRLREIAKIILLRIGPKKNIYNIIYTQINLVYDIY